MFYRLPLGTTSVGRTTDPPFITHLRAIIMLQIRVVGRKRRGQDDDAEVSDGRFDIGQRRRDDVRRRSADRRRRPNRHRRDGSGTPLQRRVRPAGAYTYSRATSGRHWRWLSHLFVRSACFGRPLARPSTRLREQRFHVPAPARTHELLRHVAAVNGLSRDQIVGRYKVMAPMVGLPESDRLVDRLGWVNTTGKITAPGVCTSRAAWYVIQYSILFTRPTWTVHGPFDSHGYSLTCYPVRTERLSRLLDRFTHSAACAMCNIINILCPVITIDRNIYLIGLPIIGDLRKKPIG